MTDYTTEFFYEYNGEEWLMLQNGEKIVMAKRSALVELDKNKYALMDDSRGKIKEISLDKSNIDIITIRK